MTRYLVKWEVHYRNEQGREVVYSQNGTSLFSFDDVANLSRRLEQESGRFHWVKSVRYAKEGTT